MTVETKHINQDFVGCPIIGNMPTVLPLISEITSQWSRDIEQVQRWFRVKNRTTFDQVVAIYVKMTLSLSKWSDFQSESTIGKI